MGCTKATKHKIEVADPKPFKKRLRNIPTVLLEEVKEHLDHMIDVGVIKPSKSAWCNVMKKSGKRMGVLGFASIFTDWILRLKRMHSHCLKSMTLSMLLVGGNTLLTWTSFRVFGKPHGGVLETIHSFYSRDTGILSSVNACPLGSATHQQPFRDWWPTV